MLKLVLTALTQRYKDFIFVFQGVENPNKQNIVVLMKLMILT